MNKLTLSDGRVAEMREAKGRDLISAAHLTDDPMALSLAVASQVLTIAGEPVLFEDLMDLSLRDAAAIQTAMVEQLGTLPTLAPAT